VTPSAGSVAATAPAVHRGRTAVPTRPSVAPRKPRRISGPTRPGARPGSARQPAAAPKHSSDAERGLLLGVLAALNSLSRNPSLDRLIRGRTWIVLIAFALIGIVTLQLLVLRLNANIGRALVREAQLQRTNAALSIESSELAAGERVESLTAKLGMELVPEGALRFLSINPSSDIARASAALNKPVQTASTSSTEAAGASSSGSGSEAGAETSAATETTAAASTSAAGSSTSQSGEASTATSETGAAAPSESSATSSPSSTATQPASPETRATGAIGATGATEAAPSASGIQAGGAG
jgi:cell division protein FtsL